MCELHLAYQLHWHSDNQSEYSNRTEYFCGLVGSAFGTPLLEPTPLAVDKPQKKVSEPDILFSESYVLDT